MDPTSREVARQLVAARNEVLAPAYRQLREELFGRLALSTTMLESMREETAQRQANGEFVAAFRDLLPRADVNGRYHVRDQGDARMLQATTLWSTFHYFGTPWMVMGKRLNPQTRDVDWLCMRTFDTVKHVDGAGLSHEYGAGNLFQVIHLKPAEAKRVEANQLALTVRELSRADVADMYQPATGDLVIGASTPGSICADEGYAYPVPLLPVPVPAKRTPTRIFPRHGDMPECASGGGPLLTTGPSDLEMGQFEVYDNLAALAEMFGVTERYQALLAARDGA